MANNIQNESFILRTFTTFQLSFKLLSDLPEADKFEILRIIKERDENNNHSALSNKEIAIDTSIKILKPKKITPPLKGSKAEKILNLYNSGLNSEKAIREILIKKRIKVHPPEIYRVLKNYTDFKKN